MKRSFSNIFNGEVMAVILEVLKSVVRTPIELFALSEEVAFGSKKSSPSIKDQLLEVAGNCDDALKIVNEALSFDNPNQIASFSDMEEFVRLSVKVNKKETDFKEIQKIKRKYKPQVK